MVRLPSNVSCQSGALGDGESLLALVNQSGPSTEPLSLGMQQMRGGAPGRGYALHPSRHALVGFRLCSSVVG